VTATASPAPPRNIAAEFAALMAEQADLSRRAFRLFEDACRQQAPATAVETRNTIEVTVAALDGAATSRAAGIPAKEPEPASENKSAPPAPKAGTDRDRILDLYASTTLTTAEIAGRLGLGQNKVQGTIVGCRKGTDPRVRQGDVARLGLHRNATPAPAKPSPVTLAAAAQPATAPRPSVIPPLAPAPRAPKVVTARPAEPVEPLPPIRTPAEAKTRADARARVLRHYGETGDYESQIAQKLGLLRAWVVAFITEARAEKDPRVTVGDGRRRMREKA